MVSIRKIVNKTQKAWAKGGIWEVLRAAYVSRLRPYLPDTYLVYNGVKVPGKRLDEVCPFAVGSRPDYEYGIVSALEETVQHGDEVVIIGGGWGVSAVTAARLAGRKGKVVVYEGSKKYFQNIKKTAKLNGVKKRLNVYHRIVGKIVKLKEGKKSNKTVDPKKLKKCDVLELDCEGAEKCIVEEMKISPKFLIVESHGHRNSPSKKIKDKMSSKPYKLISSVIAEKSNYEYCKKNDIRVMTFERI
jgi:hypothetical protein